MNTLPNAFLTVLLEPEAHRYAAQFAAEQAALGKGQRVYLNTLAVYAVRTYLNWLSIPTALHQSDCWHTGLRAILNTADLVVPPLGKLECRPILPGDTAMVLPPTLDNDRLGCVAVELDGDLRQARLRGYASATAIALGAETIPLSQLQPLEGLLKVLSAAAPVVDLRLWWRQIFPPEWQPLIPAMALAFRGSTRDAIARSKVVHFAASQQAVALNLHLDQTDQDTYHVQLRIVRAEPSVPLPLGLEVRLLDEAGTMCATAIATGENDWLQMEFPVTAGEVFSLRLTLADQSLTEVFQI